MQPKQFTFRSPIKRLYELTFTCNDTHPRYADVQLLDRGCDIFATPTYLGETVFKFDGFSGEQFTVRFSRAKSQVEITITTLVSTTIAHTYV